MIDLNRKYEMIGVIKNEDYGHKFAPPLNEEEQDYFDYMKYCIDLAAEKFPRKQVTIDFTVNNGWEDSEDDD